MPVSRLLKSCVDATRERADGFELQSVRCASSAFLRKEASRMRDTMRVSPLR